MKMEMTELGPMKRALKIEVPAEEVVEEPIVIDDLPPQSAPIEE